MPKKDTPSSRGLRSITRQDERKKSALKKKKKLNRVEQLGEELGLARSTVYDLLKRKELPGGKYGGHWIIPDKIAERIKEELWRKWQQRRKTKSDSGDDL